MNKRNAIWGLLLVVFGMLLLLNTTGLLNFNVWEIIWPIALIFLGAWVLFSSNSKFESEEIHIPLENTKTAAIEVKHGAGPLHITAGALAGELISGTVIKGTETILRHDADHAYLEIEFPVFKFSYTGHQRGGIDWNLHLCPEIPIDLIVHTGASESSIDLSGLQVKRFKLETGASSSQIVMPANVPMTYAEISAGAASLSIRIPEGTAARIQMESGLISADVNSQRFPRIGDHYESPDYETSPFKTEILFKGGVGSINIL